MRPALEQLKNKHDLVGAEIGVFHGNYTFVYLEELDIKKVFLIDPYIQYGSYTSKALRDAEKAAHEKLNIYANKIIWIKTKSIEASCFFEPESLDFVYIDGNHEHQAVLGDIVLYYSKVKKGGLMSGHDYRPEVRDNVFDAINEFCKTSNLILHSEGREWWVWK